MDRFRNISDLAKFTLLQHNYQMESQFQLIFSWIKTLTQEMMIIFKFFSLLLVLLFLLVEQNKQFIIEMVIIKIFCIKYGFFLLLLKIYNRDKSLTSLTIQELLVEFLKFLKSFQKYFQSQQLIIVSFYKLFPNFIQPNNKKAKFSLKGFWKTIKNKKVKQLR